MSTTDIEIEMDHHKKFENNSSLQEWVAQESKARSDWFKGVGCYFLGHESGLFHAIVDVGYTRVGVHGCERCKGVYTKPESISRVRAQKMARWLGNLCFAAAFAAFVATGFFWLLE